MPDKDFEQMLKDLRTQYLDKPEMTTGIKKSEIFKTSSSEEKRNKIIEAIQLLEERRLFLSDKLKNLHQQDANYEQVSKLKHQIEAFKSKQILLQQKLEYIDSGESDFIKKEKLKRQLTELELKRCRALLSKKNLSKIDEKINQKKEQLKKIK
ncbi:hypothetical protein [Lactococcus garvieae]|uniref:hypothetical protein n=1 Tax=Lactococcus garvieae TaxID=1363 RepID=UPI0018D64681|nr:hypothetical protein [Lactococcus garvieae]QPS71067.1 hypothetical protein I6G50_10185 [Lactococcus garvieae]